MSSEARLPWPAKGLSDLTSEADQPQQSTTVGVNVRNLVPTTSKAQGAQRGGFQKFCPDAMVAGERVQRIASVVGTARHFRWEGVTQENLEIEWESDTAQKSVAKGIASTLNDDMWVVDGSTTALLLNSGGVESHRIELPVDDAAAQVTAVECDDYGDVYFAVGAGSDEAEARLWCYKRSLEQGWVKRWEIAPGGYVRALRWSGGQLFVAVNSPDKWEARLQVWASVDTAAPIAAGEQVAAYPLSGVEVKDDGSVLAPSLAFDDRWKYQPDPDAWGRRVLGWTPEELNDETYGDEEAVLWSWHVASDLEQDLADGDECRYWLDRAAHSRNWFVESDAGKGPRYVSEGIGGKPTLRWDRTNKTYLTSEVSGNYADDATATQRGPFPAHENNGYMVYMVFRLTDDQNEGCVASWGAPDGSGSSRISHNTNASYAYTSGRLLYEPVVGTTTLEADVASGPRTGVLVAKFGGKASFSSELSALGWNGLFEDTTAAPVAEPSGTGQQYLGRGYTTQVGIHTDYGTFEIAEIIVLGRPNPEDAAGDPFVVSSDLNYKIVGYLAWKYGLDGEIDSGHPYALTPPEGEHTQGIGKLLGTNGLLAKYSAVPGDLKWTIDGEGDGLGGIGHAVGIDLEGDVYSVGVTESDGVNVRLLEDEGDSYTTGWTYGIQQWGDPQVSDFRVATDTFGNLYVPWSEAPSGLPLQQYTLYGFANDGTNFLRYARRDSLYVFGQAVGVPLEAPTYDDNYDFTATGQGSKKRAIWLLVGTAQDDADGSDPDLKSLIRLDLAEKEVIDQSPRKVRTIAVCGGKIRRFDSRGAEDVTGATEAPLSTARFVDSAILFGKAYFTDGLGYYRYDAATDTASTHTPNAGKIPEGFQLCAPFGQRLVYARTADEPQLWCASGLGDPDDWDFHPAAPTPDQAIYGTLSRASVCPVPITALIPFSDDILIFGGDRAIWRMRGDPGAGGYFDELSDNLGISFGMPWCKTDEGALIVFGTPFGSLYLLTPDAPPQRISKYTIEQRLQGVNLETHRVELAWDHRQEGVSVYIVPFTPTTASAMTHFFWDSKFDAWFEDEIPLTSMRPSCVATLDGDSPEDRQVVVGCMDGYIRYIDPPAKDDDGEVIHSRVILGPHQGAEATVETCVDYIDVVLDSSLDGCGYHVYVADTADGREKPVAAGTLDPGRNTLRRVRHRGSYTWIELFNTLPDQGWALESMVLGVTVGGRRRVRR